MERAEFEKLALEHLDAVYRMAYHLARKPDEAEEIVQEVYLRAMRPKTIERFQDTAADGTGGGMRAWLFAIAHNVFYSRIKKQSRAPIAVEGFHSEESSETPPDEPPPQWDGERLDWEQVDGTLKDAIADLKPEYREVLLMWGVEGLKYREIATILEVPIGTVMSRLHRARKLLADKLLGDEKAVDALGLRPETPAASEAEEAGE
jgi:RNA polymerase sigma-70 factor (ECF subfamily)